MRRALTVADSLPSEWLVTSTDWPFILYLSPFLSNSGNFLLPLQNCTSARVHGRELHEPTHPHRTRCQFPVEVERLRWWEEVETTLFLVPLILDR